MKRSLITIMVVSLLAGCVQPVALLITPTATPTKPPECNEPGKLVTDQVLFPDTEENHSIAVYLPPCYAENSNTAYPVLYWTNGRTWWQQLFDMIDQLISQGDVPAFITVLVQIDPNQGYGADAQIINYVVPYIDAHYRTQPDRLHRSITGFSHGAAIAIRAAFQAPNVFSRVAVLSGGIADGEQEKFTNWVSAMSPDQQPEVLIDIGDQDAVVKLTHHLTVLLDTLNFPYTFVHGPGNHTDEYTADHLANILKWLMSSYREAKK